MKAISIKLHSYTNTVGFSRLLCSLCDCESWMDSASGWHCAHYKGFTYLFQAYHYPEFQANLASAVWCRVAP